MDRAHLKPKIAECAKLVDKFSRENGVTFKALAFIRPDLFWPVDEFPPYHTIVEDLDWYTKTNDEIFAISGSEAGRNVAMNIVEQAECCDSVLRQPKHCFVNGFKESKTNFIQERYFATTLHPLPFPHHVPMSIARGGKRVRPGKMHGKFRSEGKLLYTQYF